MSERAEFRSITPYAISKIRVQQDVPKLADVTFSPTLLRRFDVEFVSKFSEKPPVGKGWVTGGSFVLKPSLFEYLDGDRTPFEHEPLARRRRLVAYRLWHEGTLPWKTR